MVTFHLPEGRGGAKGRKAFEQVKSDIWFVEVMGMVQNALLDRVIMSSTGVVFWTNCGFSLAAYDVDT